MEYYRWISKVAVILPYAIRDGLLWGQLPRTASRTGRFASGSDGERIAAGAPPPFYRIIPSFFMSALAGDFQLENLYAILGVAPNASDDEIKKVYRSLAMRYHPDRNQAPGAEARFKAVTKAYEILSDPGKRAEYNQSVNHRIVLDAQGEAFELWRSLFALNGVTVAP
jgi:molecular chaperone DnaJ